MVVIDTNVLVQFLTRDDDVQAERARGLIESERVHLLLTVALETEWVLRAAYGFSTIRVAGALRAFAGLPQVSVEGPQRLAKALDLAEVGVDFADALHRSAVGAGQVFATFDARLIRAAKGSAAVREP